MAWISTGQRIASTSYPLGKDSLDGHLGVTVEGQGSMTINFFHLVFKSPNAGGKPSEEQAFPPHHQTIVSPGGGRHAHRADALQSGGEVEKEAGPTLTHRTVEENMAPAWPPFSPDGEGVLFC